MKKLLMITLIIILLATSTMMPAEAKKAPKPKAFNIAGTITAVDPVARTFTVKVRLANNVARPFMGSDLMLNTTTDTVYLGLDHKVVVPVTFETLVVSQTVRVKGTAFLGVFTAKRVTEGVPLPKSIKKK